MKTISWVLLMSSCITAVAAEPDISNAPISLRTTTIFVVRHAEKVDGPGDPALNEAGQRRADALARLLKSANISACFCTQFQRTKLTAQPTAKVAAIAVQIHPAGEELGLVKKILNEHAGERVLIAAHSNTVPAILRYLGHENHLEIEEQDYDNLFVVHHRGTKTPDVLHLHYGASSGE